MYPSVLLPSVLAPPAAIVGPPVGGLPLAFKVFPKLATFPRFYPRRYKQLPIGGTTERPTLVGMERALHHVYHDLGVLVFNELTNRQIGKIGNILHNIARTGGPGDAAAFTRSAALQVRSKHRTIEGLRIHKAIDSERVGLIAPVSMVSFATRQLRNLMRRKQDLMNVEGINRIPLETQVVIPGAPASRGIIYPTILDPHYQVPLQLFSSLRVDRNHGRICGVVAIYTVGKSEYAGRVEVDYVVLQKTPNSDVAQPVWGNRIVEEQDLQDPEGHHRLTLDTLLPRIFKPLWQLEREVWADRAKEAEDEIEAKALRGAVKKGQRLEHRAVRRMKAEEEEKNRRLDEEEEQIYRKAMARERIIKHIQRKHRNAQKPPKSGNGQRSRTGQR